MRARPQLWLRPCEWEHVGRKLPWQVSLREQHGALRLPARPCGLPLLVHNEETSTTPDERASQLANAVARPAEESPAKGGAWHPRRPLEWGEATPQAGPPTARGSERPSGEDGGGKLWETMYVIGGETSKWDKERQTGGKGQLEMLGDTWFTTDGRHWVHDFQRAVAADQSVATENLPSHHEDNPRHIPHLADYTTEQHEFTGPQHPVSFICKVTPPHMSITRTSPSMSSRPRGLSFGASLTTMN